MTGLATAAYARAKISRYKGLSMASGLVASPIDTRDNEMRQFSKEMITENKFRTLKGLKLGQTSNERWFGACALVTGRTSFGVLNEDGLAKFTAISVHAWYGVVRDANRLCAFAFSICLFCSKYIKEN